MSVDITTMNRVERGLLLDQLLAELSDDELAELVDDVATKLNDKGYCWHNLSDDGDTIEEVSL